MKEPKDKTYYQMIDGVIVRIRASKKPDKETMEALTEMVRFVKNKFPVSIVELKKI